MVTLALEIYLKAEVNFLNRNASYTVRFIVHYSTLTITLNLLIRSEGSGEYVWETPCEKYPAIAPRLQRDT